MINLLKKSDDILRVMFDRNILVFICFVVFLRQPDFLFVIEPFYIIFEILLFSITFFLVFSSIFKKKLCKLLILLIIYLFILFFSTLVNNAGIFSCINYITSIVGAFLFFDQLIEKNENKFYEAFIKYFCFLSITNFLFIIIKGFGSRVVENRVYFLGYDNYFSLFTVLGCFVLFLYLIRKKHNIKKIDEYLIYFTMIINFLSCFLVTSSTAKIGMSLFAVIFSIIYLLNARIKNLFLYPVFYIFYLISFLCITVFNVLKNIPFINNILINVFHRDVTFTGRTEIWNDILNYMNNHNQILGTGFYSPQVRIDKINIYHAHSTILNVYLECGFLGVGSFIFTFAYIGYLIKKIKSKKIALVLSFGMLCYFIMSLVEVYQNIQILLLFLVLINFYSSKNLEKEDVE